MQAESAKQPDDRVQVAIAILYRDGQFLMQLRDNIPTILYPGYWGLFGGHIEPGESPEEAVYRELVEEIGYTATGLTRFGEYGDDRVIRHVYQGPLRVDVADLELNEGWDLGLLTPETIRQGECYSPIADQIRPLGPIHQKILLEFIATSNFAHSPPQITSESHR